MTTHWIFCYPKHHIHKIHIKIGIFKSMFKTCMKKNEMYRGWFENHRPSFSPPNDEPLNRTVKSTCDNWWLYASCLHNYLISIVRHSLKNLKIFSRYLSDSSIALLDTSICFFQTFCFQDVFKGISLYYLTHVSHSAFCQTSKKPSLSLSCSPSKNSLLGSILKS